MKEKNLLLKKNTFSLKRRRYSVLLSTSFILTLLTLFTLFFTRCDKDDYTGEVKGICPEVIVTDPVNGAINVSTNKVITATFNEPMQSATINESTFFVKNGVNIVSGHVTYSGTTATFTPASLLQANTVYTATVTRGATDPMGNVMRNDYTWSFNTGSLPRVILTDPVEGASDVKLDKAVTADFNTAMNAATVNSTSFLLKQGTTAVAGIVTYLGVKATFTPTLDLLPNKVYTATITNNVEDVAGNAMRNDTTWSFATGSLLLVIATDPLNGAVDVPYNKIVKATFNKLMNPATINNSTFTLMHGPTPVLGTVSYSEFTAEFTPLTDLLPGEEYTATITTGALDLSGNALIADYIWKFTTNVFVEPVLPVVLNTDPMDEAIDVPLDKVLKATFSKIMDPSSINSSTFTLMNGSTPVIGSINYSGVEATFSPITPLLPGTLYTATITTGAKDLEGNALADDYTWEFTTKDVEEPVLPVVISTDPVDEAIDVALYKVITATFSKTMDAATINASTFTLSNG
ncbi:MAG: Ig-like domain-containing protein, partial [Dysgonamonadaceae bacterium]